MKKVFYLLIFMILVVGGLVFANRKIKNETSEKPIPKPPTSAEKKAALKKWEATPDGIMFLKWKASPGGKKVLSAIEKIRKSVKNYSNMEGVVSSLSLPPGSRLGFGLMVRINDDDYILSFGPEMSNEFEQLQSLKVNDKIIIKSRGVSYAPKYSFPIVKGDYVEYNRKILYKRVPRNGGC